MKLLQNVGVLETDFATMISYAIISMYVVLFKEFNCKHADKNKNVWSIHKIENFLSKT